MKAALVIIVLLSVLLNGCSPDPVLDLAEVETRARMGEAAAMEQLVELLAGPDESVADRAYAVLVDLGARAVPVLTDGLTTTDRQQREYLVAALGTLKATGAIDRIAAILAERSLQRRYVAAWALGEINDPAVVLPLIGALSDDNPEVRRYATRALIKVNRPAVPQLVAYLDTAEGEGAAAAIRALGDIADPRALPALLAKVESPQRGEVFLALGKLRDSRAEQALVAGLADPDWQVRMNAAMALGPLGGPAAAAKLRTTLDDEVHVVREWSARSLEMITGQPVVYRNSKGEMVRPYNLYR
ncbi:MAG: HEAT repeat domain-containing protein [Desulfuromonadales bacterium]|nr:HEAT repeat domain-containing protein [Desulfuromonadales bacterium]